MKELLTYLKDHAETQVGVELMHAIGRHAKTLEQFDSVAQGMFTLKRFKESLPYAEKVLEMCVHPEQIYAAKSNLAIKINPLRCVRMTAYQWNNE